MSVQMHTHAHKEARSRCRLSFKISTVCGVSLCTWVWVHFCMCLSTCVHNADVWWYFYKISYPNSELGNVARLAIGLDLGILCCRILKLQVSHSFHLHLYGFRVQRTCLWGTDASPTVLVCLFWDILICLFWGILIVYFAVFLLFVLGYFCFFLEVVFFFFH